MDVKARIPGTIIAVNVKEGDSVKTRDTLAVMEAMKMEQPIPAPLDGTIQQVCAAPGDKVKAGQILFSIL